MKTRFGSLTLFLVLFFFSLAGHAESVTVICLWDYSPGKKQSYIIEFDEAKQSVVFNGAPAAEVSVTRDLVSFNLHFKNDVVWSHAIDRKTGHMHATKSDAPDPVNMDCGKLVNNGF